MTAFRTLAEGIGFTEGPLWTLNESLLVTSMSRGLVYRVSLDGAPAVVEAETGGGPNGLAQAADGLIYVAQNGNATIQSRSPRAVEPGIQTVNGSVVTDVAGSCLAPNDCAFGPEGRLWFTDPSGDAGETSRVCALDPATNELEVMATDGGFPNGIAFAGATTLVVVDTHAQGIIRYRLTENTLAADGLFAVLPNSGPDGIAFDDQGRLFVAAFESEEVVILTPGGQVEERIALPGTRPTNLCFAGPALELLVVTCASGGRVIALERSFSGRRPL